MPIHLLATPSDIAPVVLLPGDPRRAERIAGMLEQPRAYNRNRGLLGFTGRWQGARVSVQTTGMGAPSAAIVAEELAALGARVLLRTGTCGAIADDLRCGSMVVVDRALCLDGTTRQYLGSETVPPPSERVTRALLDASAASGWPAWAGATVSEDGFYAATDWDAWAARGAVCVEMEASAIFTVAALRGIEAGAVCLAVNHVRTGDELAPVDRTAAIDALVRLALNAAAALS